jgi:DNA modification methylase
MNKIICGDALTELSKLESESIDCCITSPPYWGLRDYGVSGQLGLEKTPEEYVTKMVEVFREVRRILKREGTLWLNLGDSYVSAKSRYSSVEQTIAGHLRNEPVSGNRPDLKGHSFLKDKDLCGIPWRVAFALQSDGWYLRQDIIWHKPNPMPESVTDRCTKSHEYIFLLAKSPKYYFDNEAIMEESIWYEKDKRAITGGVTNTGKSITEEGNQYQCNKSGSFSKIQGKRNRRSVWTITTKPFKEAHFATFPEDLIVPMVLAGCPKGGLVLDLFIGAGTTGVVAKKLDRNYIGIELNEKYVKMAEERIKAVPDKLF